MYYQFNPQTLADKTAQMKASLAKNQPNADFVEYASSVIYDRLKKNIQHYRQYGMYWWALKDVLYRQGNINLGTESDEHIKQAYRGKTDAETLVAADMFYEDMAGKYAKDNMDWSLERNMPDYRLYDEDMEMRPSITDLII